MSSNTSTKTINEVPTASESKEMEQTKETENSNQIQNITNPDELLDLSKKLYKEKKYENTFEPLQRALNLLKTTKHPNDETHVDFAEYYLLYGKALFRVQQAKNNVFGMVEEEDEEEDDVEEVEPSPQLQEVPLIGDSTESNKNDKTNDNNDINETNEKKETEIDNVSDGELCWQYFELSRLCLDKFLSKCDNGDNNNNNNNNNTQDKITLSDEKKFKYNKLLSDVHSFLGDFLLEDGKSSESLNEYEKSIEILNYINGNKRDISSIHFLASIAAEHDNNPEKVDYHQGESEMLLVEYIKDLLINNNYEIKENDEQLSFEILKQHVNNFLTKNKDNNTYTKVCKELNEVIETLDDLCKRNDTGLENENDDQIEGFDMNEFRKLLSQPDGLKALVTSEMMKNLKEPKIDDKENNNNSNNVEKEGITTFGFGENNDNDKKDEKVNELSSSCVRSKRPQKRKINESNVTNEHVPESKRAKLNPTSNTSD